MPGYRCRGSRVHCIPSSEYGGGHDSTKHPWLLRLRFSSHGTPQYPPDTLLKITLKIAQQTEKQPNCWCSTARFEPMRPKPLPIHVSYSCAYLQHFQGRHILEDILRQGGEVVSPQVTFVSRKRDERGRDDALAWNRFSYMVIYKAWPAHQDAQGHWQSHGVYAGA